LAAAPDVFDGLMRLLHEVQGSVHWLRQEGESTGRNLRKSCQAHLYAFPACRP
jgi:predicted secreted protein